MVKLSKWVGKEVEVTLIITYKTIQGFVCQDYRDDNPIYYIGYDNEHMEEVTPSHVIRIKEIKHES